MNKRKREESVERTGEKGKFRKRERVTEMEKGK